MTVLGPGWQHALEVEARRLVPDHVLAYVGTGAREGVTTAEAVRAWGEVRWWPRTLVDVREPRTATTFLGTPVAAPVAVAPTSLQRLVHPDGELAMASAVRDAGSLVVVSSNAGTTFADLGATGAAWWLQAYLTADRSLIAPALVAAAEAGARAVVLTVDTPVPGTKYDIDDDAFGDLTHAYGVNHPEAVRGRTPGAEHAQDLGPADLAWIADLTGLPVVVKGVLRADDACRAVDAGAAAVWVSNHGGRQLDRSVSSARALSGVAAAVGGDAEVYVDGGVRSGLDAMAALASGAHGVFLGRTPLLALAQGPARVTDVLETLAAELREAMRIGGVPRLDLVADLLEGT